MSYQPNGIILGIESLEDLVSNAMLVAYSAESSEAKHEAIRDLEIRDDEMYRISGYRMIHNESSAGTGLPERVKFILREFANKFILFSTDTEKNTALHLAAYYRKAQVVQMIIDEASNLPAPPSSPNNCLITIIREANDKGNTALHIAVMNRDIAIVKLLVEADPQGRHTPNCDGETPLYIATNLWSVDIIQLMFSVCTDLSLDGPRGTTVLHAAIASLPQADPHHLFEVLIHGAKRYFRSSRDDYNKFIGKADDQSQNTALHLAALGNHQSVVEHIIATYPSYDNSFLPTIIREANDKGNTALHIAVINRNMPIIELLIRADSKGRHTPNCDGETPLYIATKLRYVEIIELMFSVCKNLSLDGPRGTTVLHAAIASIPEADADPQEPAGPDYLFAVLIDEARHVSSFPSIDDYHKFIGKADDQCQNTALHLAVLGNHVSVVEQIIAASSSHRHDERNSDKKNPVHIAVEQGYESIVKALLENYFTVEDTSAFVSGPKQQTVLHGAVIGRDTACVELVLNAHKDLVNFCDEDGWTPLHHAAHLKFDSVLEWLIQAQKPKRFTESQLINRIVSAPTPLWLAAKGRHTSTVTQFLKLWPKLCVEVDHQDHQNILHLAAFQSDKETIQSILKFCPPQFIDKLLMGKDVRRDTPLHLLIKVGCFVPDLIKDERIDKTVRNKQNLTPRDMLYSHDNIIEDQLKIKKAIDDVEADKHSYLWPRSNKLKSKLKPNTQESLVPPSKQSAKDAKFKIAKKDLMKVELKLYRQRTNTQIIVTALITTVTFTVGFTMPGGYYQSGQINQGSVLLSNKAAFIAFMVSDALALALSTTSLFLYFISSMYEDPHHVSKLNFSSAVLNIFSVVAMMVTFITGTYVVLSHSPALAITVCTVCSTFFVCMFYLLIKLGCDRDKLKDILV